MQAREGFSAKKEIVNQGIVFFQRSVLGFFSFSFPRAGVEGDGVGRLRERRKGT